ncbi:hypothetical protein E2C01_008671 [Portunus trituberculatus]|uniref:Uncharacterized protein n=1 Tax=Portunus trituberculatus TaxID=210409 RepID=A0A5B7D1F1_PORTR|nr:hypothetical protein [Portunus trituberculatus]
MRERLFSAAHASGGEFVYSSFLAPSEWRTSSAAAKVAQSCFRKWCREQRAKDREKQRSRVKTRREVFGVGWWRGAWSAAGGSGCCHGLGIY